MIVLSLYYSSFIWHIDHAYWLIDDCSAIIFVKHVKTVSIQVLSLYTKQCGCKSYCCFVVKAPANAIMQHKQRLLGQSQFDMFYKHYCCAAIHCQIWMNYICTKWKLTNYAIMHWNKFCYICFQFWDILSQTRVSFTQLIRANTHNLEKSNFDMSSKNDCWSVIR